jgi:2-keto-4-pentenoate hydratase/2-oxohepta-3-ene-1,7-dioic acid hydratase in catechol pathway
MGLNYRKHAIEASMAIPSEPVHGRTPPRYLKINDVMTLSIEGLGELRQLVAAA